MSGDTHIHDAPNHTRQLLDSLVGAYAAAALLGTPLATDQAQHEETAEQRQAALRRVLGWYLHTADAAQQWLAPAEERVPLAPPADGVHPLAFPDDNAAVDWAEREHANLLHAVHSAAAAGDDQLTWQLAAVLWNAQAPSAPGGDWLSVGHIGLAAAERLGDDTARALLLTDLGMAYTRVNSLDESLECHRQALTIWRALEDPLSGAHSLNLIGLVHLRRRQLAEAAQYFEQAIAAFQSQGATHWEATALSNLAGTHYRAGHLSQAAATIDRALAAHRSLDNRRGEGNALHLLSNVQREQGAAAEAVASAQAAVEIALSLRAQRLEGFWLITLGDAQRANSLPGEALDSYQRAASLHRRLGNRSREALAWHGVGETYAQLDRNVEAADFYRQAAAVHHELGDGWSEALSLDGLARSLHSHDVQAAQQHWAEALRLLADYDDPRAAAQRGWIEEQLRA